MTPPTRSDEARGEARPLPVAIAALFVAGLAFRAPILVVGPLLPGIQADLGMGHGVAGLLSSIPVLCMALLAPVGPIVGRSLGPRAGVAACIAAAAAFGIVRALAPTAAGVLAATVGIGVGMGVVGPILTMAVRTSAPRHATLGTGAYAMGYIVGSSGAAAAAVPLAALLGGWRGAFAAVGVATAIVLVGWWLLAPSARHVRVAPAAPDLPWRRPAGWLLGLAFGLQSILFYGCVAWLPSIYIERGWSPSDAATLAAYFAGLGIVTTLLVPPLAQRVRSRRRLLAVAAAVSVVGSIGIATGGSGSASSGALLAVAAVTALGFGIGVFFPVTLTLPVDVASTPAESSSVAALMFLVGYLLASVGPVVLGAIRDATGDFRTSAWALVAIALVMLSSSALLSDRRLHAGRRRAAER